MRIGELARDAGVTPKAVRYYESLGLLAPERLANGYRDYDRHAVRVVREVRRLISLGIPAERTRPFLDCLADGGEVDDCPSSLAGYREAIADLEVRIRDLTERRDALARRLREAACRRPPESDPVTVERRHEEPAMDDYYTLPLDLPVPGDDGAADHLPGRALPDLWLMSTAQEIVGLDALGPGRTVLYVYPLTRRPEEDIPEGWNAIPGARGCTVQACDFRDHHDELRAAGADRVFGLSSQDTDYQRELAGRLRLPFAMLSDPRLRLAEALDLPTFEARGQTLYKRLTLVIRDGMIEHCFYPVFPPDRHAAQVLRWLADHPVAAPVS
ncbi:MAG: redoxin family protein [Catenulispora sp.]|nr:redoxin family protein [Catenulispora sp.]